MDSELVVDSVNVDHFVDEIHHRLGRQMLERTGEELSSPRRARLLVRLAVSEMENSLSTQFECNTMLLAKQDKIDKNSIVKYLRLCKWGMMEQMNGASR